MPNAAMLLLDIIIVSTDAPTFHRSLASAQIFTFFDFFLAYYQTHLQTYTECCLQAHADF